LDAWHRAARKDDRATMTPSEQKILDDIGSADNVVIKMTALGNPDFIVIPIALADSIRFVEAKSGSDTVRPHQQSVHEKLRDRGFRVDVIRAEDLRVESSLRSQRRARGEGGLFKVKGSRFWRAQYVRAGKVIRVSTGETIKHKALAVLQRLR
jgi:hypothetical protein